MMTNAKYVPESWPTVVPRIVADDPEALVAFVKHVFDAAGTFNDGRPSELRIGDSMLMISSPADRDRIPAFLYVYVPDTDLSYQRALSSGATSIEEPRDLPYGDRRAMVRDRWGNTWQIATHSGRFTP
jgi:PhnB protein